MSQNRRYVTYPFDIFSDYSFAKFGSFKSSSNSLVEQAEVEESIKMTLEEWNKERKEMSGSNGESYNSGELFRSEHISYLMNGLRGLSKSSSSMETNRAWLLYWILNSLDMLGGITQSFREEFEDLIINWISLLEHKDGGYGGGPKQLAHTAPTYASILSLSLLKSDKALSTIDRDSILSFFLNLKQPNGSFRVQIDGEADVRGAYTVILVADLLNIRSPELELDLVDYLCSCQTYEGGFGGEPGNEAHGGYTFCAVAALAILKPEALIAEVEKNSQDTSKVNISQLFRWLHRRQLLYEGGFQGRTNKLVDGCYSFWVGAALQILYGLNPTFFPDSTSPSVVSGSLTPSHSDYPDNFIHLQRYILLCCQNRKGGLCDKPNKGVDCYHTCYCLAGLSISQHGSSKDLITHTQETDVEDDDSPRRKEAHVLGSPRNLIGEICPIYSISPSSKRFTKDFFLSLDSSS